MNAQSKQQEDLDMYPLTKLETFEMWALLIAFYILQSGFWIWVGTKFA